MAVSDRWESMKRDDKLHAQLPSDLKYKNCKQFYEKDKI